MAFIILVRHGESEHNQKNLISGQSDPALTAKGRQQARDAAKALKGISIDTAYVSQLNRAQETLREILAEAGVDVPIVCCEQLNERDFGEFTGRPKEEIYKELGHDGYVSVVSGWDRPAPGGESLKMVHDRVVPYFMQQIHADAKAGMNIIVSAHRQVLRALLKYLNDVPSHKVASIKLGNAEVVIYEVDEQTGKMTLQNGGVE